MQLSTFGHVELHSYSVNWPIALRLWCAGSGSSGGGGGGGGGHGRGVGGGGGGGGGGVPMTHVVLVVDRVACFASR